MKIYDMAGLPNPARVRIALAEKGVADQVEFVPVDFMGGEHRTPAFKAKNPDATVPLLELDDGTCISHCNAITEYIDQRFDGPSLCGTTPTERATIQMMNLRAQEGLLDALVTYFHHATPGLGPVLETYQLPEWGLRQRERALATMHYLDGVLAERPYLAGIPDQPRQMARAGCSTAGLRWVS
jgi:glutathione S-transferase